MISLAIHDSRLRSQWGRDQLYPEKMQYLHQLWKHMEAVAHWISVQIAVAIWGHGTLPRSSRRLWRIKVCVDQLSGPMASGGAVCSPCAPFQSSKNGLRSQPFPLGTSASSPPCRGNLKWFFLPGLLRGFDQLPEVNPTLADGKLSPKFTTWRWRTPWVTFYTSQKGLTSNWTWSISKWLTYEIMLPSGQPT